MKETLRMMNSILTGKERNKSEKELIYEYQKGLYPNILAYFYSSNFGIIYNTSKLYSKLNDDDKASFCLQELDKSLKNFQFDYANSFISYFMKCYKNRLRMESEQLEHQLRKISLYCTDIDDCQITYEDELESEYTLMEELPLSEKEHIQCKLKLIGYSFREISKILKVKPITIYKRNAIIKEKINNYIIN